MVVVVTLVVVALFCESIDWNFAAESVLALHRDSFSGVEENVVVAICESDA